ncbi:MAG: helix-turn-helix transcriptional regulator [Terriglobia bacterium]
MDSQLAKGSAFQIQSMRAKKEWTQGQLAERLGSNQNAVYRLENPNYGKQTLTTLKKVAAAFDVALIVRFVPFSQLLDWVRGAPYVDPGLSEDALIVPSFDEEMRSGRCNEQPISPSVEVPEATQKVVSIADRLAGKSQEAPDFQNTFSVAQASGGWDNAKISSGAR